VPLAVNAWDLLDRGSQNLIASKLLTQEYNLQNYSLVRVEIFDIYSRVIAMFISNSSLLKLSRSYVQLSNSNNKGADWVLAMEPFKYLFDLERLSNVIDNIFNKGFDDFHKIEDLCELVTKIYPDTATLSLSDYEKRIHEVGLKLLDNLVVVKELRSFLDLVDNIPTVFPVVSKTGCDNPSTSEKAMFLLNEYKNLVITSLASSVIYHKKAAVPVSLNTHDVLFLVESQYEEESVRYIVDSVNNKTQALLGCDAWFKITSLILLAWTKSKIQKSMTKNGKIDKNVKHLKQKKLKQKKTKLFKTKT